MLPETRAGLTRFSLCSRLALRDEIPAFLVHTRRSFLKTSAVAAAAWSLPRFSIGQTGVPANSKINVACIGIHNRGFVAVGEMMKDPRVNLVALCDVDQLSVKETMRRGTELKKTAELTCADITTVPVFSDYREMFAKMADKIDAVTVSTPDHHHFPAAMLAIKHGKHVYVEKPLTHSVGEARALRDAAKKKGVVTQMGNQGRATEGIRLIKEWTDAGVLGTVREVHAWSPEFPEKYFTRPPSLPLEKQTPPSTIDWNVWLGPAETRPTTSCSPRCAGAASGISATACSATGPATRWTRRSGRSGSAHRVPSKRRSAR
jgi:hypothetical protein